MGGPSEGLGSGAATTEEPELLVSQPPAAPPASTSRVPQPPPDGVPPPPAIDLTMESESESSATADGVNLPGTAAQEPAAAQAKKTFALFDKGNWGAASAAAAEATTSADAVNTLKRPRRAAAAKADTARQAGVAAFLAATELPDDADAFQIMGASMKNGAGALAKRKKSAGGSIQAPAASSASKKAGPSRPSSPAKKSPPQPVPAPAPPKPISLKVKGTVAAQDSAQVHSFFAARPRKREDEGQGAPSASTTSSSASQPSVAKPMSPFFGPPKVARKAQLEPEWPSSTSIHVQPGDRSGTPARAPPLPSIGPFNRKGKGRAAEELQDDGHATDPTASREMHYSTLALPRSATEATAPIMCASIPPGAQHIDLDPGLTSDPPDLASLRGKVAPAIERAYLNARAAASAQQASKAPADDGQLWTERFRPQNASEVLGNEDAAAYLRDWLRELQIRPAAVKGAGQNLANGATSGSSTPGPSQPSRKRRVVQTRVDRPKAARAIKRRRGAAEGYGPGSTDDEDDGMANFIVDDDDEQEAWLQQFYPSTQESEDDLTLHPPSSIPPHLAAGSASPASTTTDLPAIEPPAPHDAASPQRFDPEERLTNCILLVGPVGAGKTSATYACAAELGFEVFELFPGMRKRAGKDLASAVGELGRNHMVGSGGSAGGAAGLQRGGGSMLSKLMDVSKAGVLTDCGTKKDVEDNGGSTGSPKTGPTVSGSPITRQSLILVEEVDVIFEDDKGFWAGIVDLVAESKRPVVLTCNDISQVPVESLPLQTVLFFEAPAPEIVVPYLQLCAASAGAACPVEAVRSLYLSTRSSAAAESSVDFGAFEGLQDGPTSPSRPLSSPDKATLAPTAEAIQALDLRRAMMQLQYMAQHAKRRGQGVPNSHQASAHQAGVLKPATPGAEMISGAAASLDGTERAESSGVQQLRELSRSLELASFASGFAMSPSLGMVSEAFEPAPASDLVWQGCNALPTAAAHQGCPAAVLEGHVAIEEALIEGATRLRPAGTVVELCERGAFDRLEHSQLLWSLLSPLRISLHSRLPRLEAVVDYAPYIRFMVAFDEAEREAHDKLVSAALAEQQSKGEGSRMTRNSLRHLVGSHGRGVEYEGWLDLEAEGVEAARRTSFDFQGFP